MELPTYHVAAPELQSLPAPPCISGFVQGKWTTAACPYLLLLSIAPVLVSCFYNNTTEFSLDWGNSYHSSVFHNGAMNPLDVDSVT